jgi:hypothetical protein
MIAREEKEDKNIVVQHNLRKRKRKKEKTSTKNQVS